MRWHRHLFAATLLLRHPETGDILLESLEEGRSLISIKKTAERHGSIALCLPAMHALTGCDTVPKMFDIEKVPALNVLGKNPLNHLGDLDALSEVIAEQANTFVARCYGAKSSVGMTRIRFVLLNKVYTLTSLKKTSKTGWYLLILGEKYNLDIVIPPHPSLLIFDLCFRKPTLHLFMAGFDPLMSLSTWSPSNIWCNKSMILTA